MSKTNSIVEINGNRYDGVTGRLLTPRKPSMPLRPSAKKMIDGFVVGPHQKPKLRQPTNRNSTKAQTLHQRTQKSTTLMRKAVKKPAGAAAAGKSAETLHARTTRLHPVREIRAKTVERHHKVNRFGLLPSRNEHHALQNDASKMAVTAKAKYRDEDGSSAPRVPSMVTSVSHQKLERLLDEALLRADAHQQMMKSQKRSRRIAAPIKRLPKWLSLTVALVIVLAVAFWLVWQNLPSVAVHVAAARSHVSATLPNYTPSGFSFAGPIKYNEGQVTMQYKSDEGQYSITQKASNWNSTSMANNYLPAGEASQSSLVDGTTVYLYGKDNDAAWVNHNVLYSLKNDAGLTSDQIFKIVRGL